jgi:hypothetical protein
MTPFIEFIACTTGVSLVISAGTIGTVWAIDDRDLFKRMGLPQLLAFFFVVWIAVNVDSGLIAAAWNLIRNDVKITEAPKDPQAFLASCQASSVRITSQALSHTQELTISCSKLN